MANARNIDGDWSRLTAIVISFSGHPNYPQAQEQFNLCYGGEIDQPADLFMDHTQKCLRHNALYILHSKLTQIIINSAVETTDRARARAGPIVRQLTFGFRQPSNNLFRNLRNVEALATYMTRSLASGDYEVSIVVNISRLFIDQRTPTRYLNFDSFDVKRFPESPTRPIAPMGESLTANSNERNLCVDTGAYAFTLAINPKIQLFPSGATVPPNSTWSGKDLDKVVLITNYKQRVYFHEDHSPNRFIDVLLEEIPDRKHCTKHVKKITIQAAALYNLKFAFFDTEDRLVEASADETADYLKGRVNLLRQRKAKRMQELLNKWRSPSSIDGSPPTTNRLDKSLAEVVIIPRRGGKFKHEQHPANKIIDALLDNVPDQAPCTTFLANIAREAQNFYTLKFAYADSCGSGQDLDHASGDDVLCYLSARFALLLGTKSKKRCRENEQSRNFIAFDSTCSGRNSNNDNRGDTNNASSSIQPPNGAVFDPQLDVPMVAVGQPKTANVGQNRAQNAVEANGNDSQLRAQSEVVGGNSTSDESHVGRSQEYQRKKREAATAADKAKLDKTPNENLAHVNGKRHRNLTGGVTRSGNSEGFHDGKEGTGDSQHNDETDASICTKMGSRGIYSKNNEKSTTPSQIHEARGNAADPRVRLGAMSPEKVSSTASSAVTPESVLSGPKFSLSERITTIDSNGESHQQNVFRPYGAWTLIKVKREEE